MGGSRGGMVCTVSGWKECETRTVCSVASMCCV